MDKHCAIRIKVPEDIFNQVQEVSNILKKRGWKPKDTTNIQDLLFLSLLKGFTSQFKNKFIEDHTPVDFLVQEALKEPSMRIKLNQFLKTNHRKSSQGNSKSKEGENK